MLYLLSKIFKVQFAKLCLIGFLGLLFLSACEPCHQLADYICACESTVIAQDSCRKALDMRSGYWGFDMARDENICVETLSPTSKCDCQAIQNHEYEKCGMTRKNAP